MSDNSSHISWHDVRTWGVEGKGWDDTERYFDRLPAAAGEQVRPPVWNLARHSAGMSAGFITDAAEIQVRYTLYDDSLALPHMPATGVSGVDLYGQDTDGVYRWIGVSMPAGQTVEAVIGRNLNPERRSYRMYLPLYNGVDSVEIGIAEDADFEPVPPRTDPPLVFYGTSITQGACASRPGMAYPAILSRWLNRPIINLGFSGNGQMEEAVTDCLTELNAGMYIIDCLPNMTVEQITERTAPLVRQLRSVKPDTPILLVEDRTFTNASFSTGQQAHHRQSREALRQAFTNLKKAGVDRLYYMEGADILGDDGEAATDGSHPNDLGMLRYARAFLPAIQQILHPPA